MPLLNLALTADRTYHSWSGILLTAIQHPTNIRLAKAASAGGRTSSAPSSRTQPTGDGTGNAGQGAVHKSSLNHSPLDLDHEAQAQIVRDIMASGGVSGCCNTVVVHVLAYLVGWVVYYFGRMTPCLSTCLSLGIIFDFSSFILL